MKLPRDAIARVVRDFDGIDLGDPRRGRRLSRAVGKLAAKPGASLPDAMEDEAELEGLYRLVNNECVTFDAVLGAHAKATANRCRDAGEVLIVHDTTTCESAHADANEIGHLPTGKAGFLLHLSLAVDAREWRRPLGILSAETISRPKRSRRRKRSSGTETSRWEDRESERWRRGVTQAAQRLADVKRVHVLDREGDSYELLDEMVSFNEPFVIRIRHDRRARTAGAGAWSTVRNVVEGVDGMLEREVELSTRKRATAPAKLRTHAPRKARLAQLRFSATTVEIPRPQYLAHPVAKTLLVNIVHVVEDHPPADQEPVEWLLYTTEPIVTADDVARVVDIYRTRWLIEEFNKALKTGCGYEERQFESLRALLVVLAMTLPVACELLWLRSRARTHPDAPATEVMTPTQIAVLRAMGSRDLSATPTVREALLALAAMGGHQRSNGEPGWLVLHRGMTKLLDREAAWRAALTAHGHPQTPDAADM